MSTPALLALEDGTVFEGSSIGALGEAVGEVVFNTAMTGYQDRGIRCCEGKTASNTARQFVGGAKR